jgi:proteasome lid subunit RPN8/RPN11
LSSGVLVEAAASANAVRGPGAEVLVLTAEVLGELRRSCEQAHPSEACGLLLGGHSGVFRRVSELTACRNAACHDTARHFELDPADFVRAAFAAARRGLDVVAVYHSHPDAPGWPSVADAVAADVAWMHVIVPVATTRDGVRAGAPRAFVRPEPLAPRLVERRVVVLDEPES